MASSFTGGLEPRLLDSLRYPTDKDVLLERARELELPSAIQEAIRRFPSRSFRSRAELVAAVEEIDSEPI
jgi:hypothetical protein